MIAATLLTIIGGSLVAAFIQNARFSQAVAIRTVAITTAIGVSEQIRAVPYADFAPIHDDATNKSLLIELFDPNVTDNSSAIDVSDEEAVKMAISAAKSGMRLVKLPINLVDGAPMNSDWTYANVPLVLTDAGTSAKRSVEMRFWVTCQKRQPTIIKNANGTQSIVTQCQLFEIALIYQWRNPNLSSSKWQSGVIRMVTPNLDMNIPAAPVAAS
ncbi:MAG TPA: hypothetical protein VK178_04855 [Opitutaceae bacterium]|nr:hypothetical protein [Opitutaceae bacterium]